MHPPAVQHRLDEVVVRAAVGPRAEELQRNVGKSLALVPLASAKAIEMQDEDPDRADALVARGKPAPDLFHYVAQKMSVAPRDCLVVEDSPVGVAAAVAAGMTAIGFAGASHAQGRLSDQLRTAGARAVISDMRLLKGAVSGLRGW